MARRKEDFVDRFIQEDGSTFEADAKMQKRHWFLCVNENAECFKNIPDIVQFLNEKSDRFYHYAYILHDKDYVSMHGYEKLLEDAYSKDSWDLFDRCMKYEVLPETERTPECWAYKPKHYHVLLSFQDAKTWSFIKRHFPGAHLQTCISVGRCFNYLTHDTDECVRMGKPKYDADLVVMDKGGLNFFKAKPLDEMNFRYFNPHLIAKYVFVDNLTNFVDFCLEFSAVQVQRWLPAINSMCEVRKELELKQSNSFNGEYCGNKKFAIWDNDGLHFVSDKEITDKLNTKCIFCETWEKLNYIENLHFSDFGEMYYKIQLSCYAEFSPVEEYLIWKYLPSYAKKYQIPKRELDLQCESDFEIFFDDEKYSLEFMEA